MMPGANVWSEYARSSAPNGLLYGDMGSWAAAGAPASDAIARAFAKTLGFVSTGRDDDAAWDYATLDAMTLATLRAQPGGLAAVTGVYAGLAQSALAKESSLAKGATDSATPAWLLPVALGVGLFAAARWLK